MDKYASNPIGGIPIYGITDIEVEPADDSPHMFTVRIWCERHGNRQAVELVMFAADENDAPDLLRKLAGELQTIADSQSAPQLRPIDTPVRKFSEQTLREAKEAEQKGAA